LPQQTNFELYYREIYFAAVYEGSDLDIRGLFHKELKIFCLEFCFSSLTFHSVVCKSKAVPSHAWSGPEGSRKLRFLDFMTTAQDGGKVVRLTHRPPLPLGNTPGTHFCYRLSRTQGHSATRRIMSLKNFNDTIGNRTCYLPVCSVVP
jgi:hypothetical protein